MEDINSCSSEYKEQGLSTSVSEEEVMTSGGSSESLETKITNRAQEISQGGDGHGGQTLACWLKAAREILSKDSGSPHWII